MNIFEELIGIDHEEARRLIYLCKGKMDNLEDPIEMLELSNHLDECETCSALMLNGCKKSPR